MKLFKRQGLILGFWRDRVEEEEVFVDYKNAVIIMCMMVVRGLDDVLEDAARFTSFAWTSVILTFRSCALSNCAALRDWGWNIFSFLSLPGAMAE